MEEKQEKRADEETASATPEPVAANEPNEEGTDHDAAEETPIEDDVIIAEVLASDTPAPQYDDSNALKAIIEAAIYITDEPLTVEQIAGSLDQSEQRVKEILARLVDEYTSADHGLMIREVAGGYKLATKPELHDSIRQFVRRLQAPLKLSNAALETLAVIAYRQPITAPEIMDVRGVQGVGVLKTLLDRKLVAAAGRKNVLGKPMMYKTTREFLVQFGLNSLAELPTLKEFEELGRLALSDSEEPPQSAPVQQQLVDMNASSEAADSESSPESESGEHA